MQTVSELRKKAKRSKLLVAILLSAAVALLLMFFVTSKYWEAENDFTQNKNKISVHMDNQFNLAHSNLLILSALERSSQQMTGHQFTIIGEEIMHSSPYNKTLYWVRQIEKSQRQKLIEEMEEKGFFSFRIKQRTSGKWVDVTEKDHYSVITIAYPNSPENLMNLGFDIDTEKALDSALHESIETARTTVARSELLATVNNHMFLMHASYGGLQIPKTVEERKQNIHGLFVLELDLEGMFLDLFKKGVLSEDMDIRVETRENEYFHWNKNSTNGAFPTHQQVIGSKELGLPITIDIRSSFNFDLSFWFQLLFLALISLVSSYAIYKTVDSSWKNVIERKIAESNLSDYKDHLEELIHIRTQELEAFTYSISHDLRAPLRAINGFGKILLNQHHAEIGEQSSDLMQRIIRASNRMGEMIDALLSLSRLNNDDIKSDQIDLGIIADEVIESLQAGDVDHFVDFEKHGDLRVFADKQLMRICLDNLLGNAWKYTKETEKPKIVFSSEEIEGELIFSIKDNGIGFNMEYSQNLFTPFQRLHSGEKYEGLGIGLATVNRII
ncbi:MAG: CHASE domain-containing protein, partial [Candidatus Bathyarchaeota archaeon]|nr:CHASE domain-containing protein [Candidatus Bathyarchaeota archaeon]